MVSDLIHLDDLILRGSRMLCRNGDSVSEPPPDLAAVAPLSIREVTDGNTLVLHPPSGAWVIVRKERLPILQGILRMFRPCASSGAPAVAGVSVVRRLLDAGILRRIDPARSKSDVPSKADLRPVKVLLLKLTTDCNLSCRYCYEANYAAGRQRLDLRLAQTAIDQAIECAARSLYVVFHGGEALLAFPEMQELTAFAQVAAQRAGKEVRFSVATNGTRFRDEIVNFLLAHRFTVSLSLDGTPDINDALRVDHGGRGSHTSIESALRKYTALTARTGIMSTVTRLNAKHLTRVAEHARHLGVTAMKTILFYPQGRGAEHPVDLSPTAEDIIEGQRALVAAVESGWFDDFEIVPVLIYLNNILSNRRISGCQRPGGCMAANELISITAKGDIDGCDCRPGKALRIGSLLTSTIAAAREGPAGAGIRQQFKLLPSACAECDFRVICGGPCRGKSTCANPTSEIECIASRALIGAIFESLSRSGRLIEYAARHQRPGHRRVDA